MKTAGIVAEYNPFHTGHAYQIARTRGLLGADCAVVAVMSGNWVQRGACAAADKCTRAGWALAGGADLVLELPTVWAASSAESFATGAVALLRACGVVDVLSFGSESGDPAALAAAAACLDSEAYRAGLSRFLDEGMPFAACRQAVVAALLGSERAKVLSRPNDNLGVEYLRALDRMGSAIRPVTVRREGAPHDSLLVGETPPEFLSATQLRAFLEAEDWRAAEPYLPGGGAEVLRRSWGGMPGPRRVEGGLLARLRPMTAGDWAALPDSGAAEGLPPRLERAGKQCRSLEEFFQLAKPRHWTQARLRRLLVWAFLGLTRADRPDAPPYLRVLGMTPTGQAILRQAQPSLPLALRTGDFQKLGGEALALFEQEARADDLYALSLPAPLPCGQDYTQGLIKVGF